MTSASGTSDQSIRGTAAVMLGHATNGACCTCAHSAAPTSPNCTESSTPTSNPLASASSLTRCVPKMATTTMVASVAVDTTSAGHCTTMASPEMPKELRMPG